MKALPDIGDGVESDSPDPGEQVNPGYPSYIIAPRKPYGLYVSWMGWSSSPDFGNGQFTTFANGTVASVENPVGQPSEVGVNGGNAGVNIEGHDGGVSSNRDINT